MKCLNCQKEIPEDCKWCSIDCKENLYKTEYMGTIMAQAIETEYKKNKRKERKKAIQEYNLWRQENPGKGFTDYLWRNDNGRVV
jgi:hypothetical protein